jgi:hypothetical protein
MPGEDRKLPSMPRFDNEAEEAQWWFDHREELAQDMVAAARSGNAGNGLRTSPSRKLEEAKTG